MSSILWSAGILVAAVAGILGLRTLSRRVRIGFDIVCLIALSIVLHQHGASPISAPELGPADGLTTWLRVITAAWWLVCARVAVAALYFTLNHHHKSREAKLFVDLAAAAVYIGTGLIVVKWVLALPIGGLVATSGIVAIVLGLALQSTLSDVFSGIAVGIEAPFQVGDRISLRNNGSHVEGHVIEMNWRSVRIQTDGADIAIIPNSVVAKLDILNRSSPSRRRDVSAEFWCPAVADPERVTDILQHATLLCPAILETPAPSVALSHVGPRLNCYTISFSVADTQSVTPTRSLLLRQARRQLYHAGLLERGSKRAAKSAEERFSPAALPLRQLLGQLTLFECLEPRELEELARRVQTRLLEPGEVLFAQGSSDATVYVVASGVLEVIQSTEGGATTTLGNLGAGEYIGEIGLLTGAPHGATARARTHCCVHQLARDAMAPLLAANPEMAATLDKSARRGLDLLRRSVAARVSQPVGRHFELLQRIRAFFRERP